MTVIVNLTKDAEQKDFEKWSVTNLSGQHIQINDNGTIDFYFVVPGFPFCTDGYRDEIKDEIKKRGYTPGLGPFVSKENIYPNELIECLMFSSAYEYTFFSIIGDKPLRYLNISVSEFMEKIEQNIKKFKENKMFRLNWDCVYIPKIENDCDQEYKKILVELDDIKDSLRKIYSELYYKVQE